jgi:hypothetical protein
VNPDQLGEPSPTRNGTNIIGGVMPDLPRGSEAPRSSFVTVVAWIFIVLAGFTTFISVLQNIMINTMFPLDELRTARASEPGMPPFFDFIFGNIRLFFLAILVVSAVTCASAIGLLLRKNWARLVFIAILALGIAWNLGGLVLQQIMIDSMMKFPMTAGKSVPADFEAGMQGMMIAIRVFSAVFALGFSVLYGWLIKRLISPSIVAEFR